MPPFLLKLRFFSFSLHLKFQRRDSNPEPLYNEASTRRHDTQHNDLQHKDTLNKGLTFDTQHK